MSYWYLPLTLDDDARKAALLDHELALTAAGLPDLSKAQGEYQVAEWLRGLKPQAPPEQIANEARYYWRLSHDVTPEDILIVSTNGGKNYMLGEVAAAYHREPRAQGMAHILPVHWRHTEIRAQSVPKLGGFVQEAGVFEIDDDVTLTALKKYVPSLKKGNASFFRWLGIIILIFELIYFWPKS